MDYEAEDVVRLKIVRPKYAKKILQTVKNG